MLASTLAVVSSVAAQRNRQLLAYRAFNCTVTCGDANFMPETVSQSAASMTSNFEPDAAANETGTTLNSVPPYEARSALTLRTGSGGINSGRNLTWRVSSSGSSGVHVSFAARGS